MSWSLGMEGYPWRKREGKRPPGSLADSSGDKKTSNLTTSNPSSRPETQTKAAPPSLCSWAQPSPGKRHK